MSEPIQSPPAVDLTANLSQIQARIQSAAERAGRTPERVALIAVSKKQSADAIRAAYHAGQRAFGESYLQEALDKMAELADLDIEWHFIGRIQANKTRQIASQFDWVHGLADAAHARRLSDQRPLELTPLKICIQVNLSGETSKAGIAPDAVAELLALGETLPGLQISGFMTLPAPSDDETTQREPFRALRLLRDQLATPHQPLPCLSMGMSDDLDAAIVEGATMVRIGTAIFGARLDT